MKNRLLTLLTIFSLSFSLTACSIGKNSRDENLAIKEKGKLYMSTNAEFPPYEFYAQKEIKGIDIDIAREIAKKMNLELVIEDTAFDAVLLQVNSGKADIGLAGLTVSEDRLKNVDFTDSYASSKQVIIVTEDSPINNIKDIKDKNIGVLLGSVGDVVASEESKTIERYAKGVEAANALSQKKIDAVVIDDETAKIFVKEIKNLKILEESYPEEKYAIAVKKGNTALKEKLNQVLKELKENKTIDNIIKKYIKAE